MAKKSKVRIKPQTTVPTYMKGPMNQRASAGSRKSHPDYFVPTTGVTYWVVLLPAHPKHPKDENGDPSPYVVVERYFNYKTPDSDVRTWPVLSYDLVKERKDPLFNRSARLLASEDENERKQGWKLKAKSRVLMNVLVYASKEKGVTKKGKELGLVGVKPHIMEVGNTTWTEQFKPLMVEEDIESDETLFYDIFGASTDVVPLIEIRKSSKGSKAYEVEWRASRTSKAFEITEKLRKRVLDILAHETNEPHTAKELKECFALAAVEDTEKSAASDEDYAFGEHADEYDDDDDSEDVADPDDEEEEEVEEEEEEKPKKKKKKVVKAPPKKKKKKKPVVEEDEEEEDYEFDEDEDDEGMDLGEDDDDDDTEEEDQ